MLWTEESVAYLRDAVSFSDYYQTIARRIAPQLPPNARVCDAGCGMGWLSLALAPHCAHVTAVDRSSRAIEELRRQPPCGGLTALCAEIADAAPAQPYDAMVFCLFGGVEETLRIAARQCAGDVFLVKRDYASHRFSAGEESLGDFTAESTARALRERGVPYRAERFSAEFGQPFRSLAAAERFFQIYNRSADRALSREEIAARLTAGPSEEFPYYLPHEKKLCLFRFCARDISEASI